MRFMIYDGTMNAATMIKFMKRVIKSSDKKVFLILYNLRVHHGKLVKRWVQDHSDQIELFFLPSYSPELNPDEYLNCDLKDGVHSGPVARSKKQRLPGFRSAEAVSPLEPRACPGVSIHQPQPQRRIFLKYLRNPTLLH